MLKKFLDIFIDGHQDMLIAQLTEYGQRCQHFQMIFRHQVPLDRAYH